MVQSSSETTPFPVDDAGALPLTPLAQSRLIRKLYAAAAPGMRWRQSLRPFLAPLGEVLEATPARSRIMDVGCGGGLYLLTLAASGRITDGFGFDASGQAIAAAHAASKDSGLAGVLRFEHRDVEAGIPDGHWPIVSLIDVLHHIPAARQRSLVVQLPLHVAPGGRLIIREPVRRPLWRNLANMLHDLILSGQLVHARDPEEIEEWLADSGLTLVRKHRSNVLWYGYWLLVYERPTAGSGRAG